jgi:hypothetical protein
MCTLEATYYPYDVTLYTLTLLKSDKGSNEHRLPSTCLFSNYLPSLFAPLFVNGIDGGAGGDVQRR